MEQPRRRLSAVWFADIVGYTPLSARDEPAALALVSALQRISREITEGEHEGRVVKFIGDAVLAEFSSTESAVRAAVAVQERFGREAAALGQDTTLRIGVHLGEVTATPDGDLYGDGINTAARLQHEAQPGQVIASEDVWRQLRQRPEFRFDSLGDVELKGITARVGVYDVLFGARAAMTPPPAPGHVIHSSPGATAASAPSRSAAAPPTATPTARSNGAWIAAGIVLAALIGVGGYAMLGRGGSDTGTAAAPSPSPTAAEGTAADSAALAAASDADSSPASPNGAPPGPSGPGPSGSAPSGSVTGASSSSATTSGAGAAPVTPNATTAAGTTASGTNTAATTPAPGGTADAAGDALPPLPANVGFTAPPPNAPPLPGTPIPPQALQAAQRMALRYVQVLNAPNPVRALRQIYPSVTPLQINAVQQMKTQFGPGLTVKPGALQATRARGDTLNVRFTLLMSSPTRPEVPAQFEGKLLPTPQGLQWVDLRRIVGGGGRL